MSPSRFITAGVLACVFLVAGCNDPRLYPPKTSNAGLASAVGVSTPAPTAAPKASALNCMLGLVPEGTVALVYIPKVKEFEDAISRIEGASNSKKKPSVNLAQLARKMGLELNEFDLSRPASVALTQPRNGKSAPGVTMILPVRDERGMVEKLKSINPKGSIEAADGYVVMSERGSYKRAGLSPQLEGGLPEGDLVIRLDVAALWKAYGPTATAAMESGIESMGSSRGGGSAVVKPAFESMLAFVEAASSCDVVLNVDGTMMDLDATVRFSGKAKVPALDVFAQADLARLARSIPDEGLMSCAVAVNPQKLWSTIEPLLETSLASYPEPAANVARQAFDSMGGALKLIGNGMVVSGGITDGRLEVVGALETPDPAAYVKRMLELTTAFPTEDSPLTRPEARTVDGMPVTTLRVRMTTGNSASSELTKAMFGSEYLTYNFVTLPKQVVMVVGSEELLERVIQCAKADASAPQGSMSKALAAAGSDTVGYFRMDLGAFMREAAGMAARTGKAKRGSRVPVAPNEPIPFTCILNRGPNEIRGRVSFDMGKIAKLQSTLMK